MTQALAIRTDLHDAVDLRRRARREGNRRTATRMLAVAHAMEGISRADAARLAGMERQALRDAVLRYNAEGLDGCHSWMFPALCRWIEARFSKRLHPGSLSRVVRGLDLSRQKTRPVHPRTDAKAQAAFAKGGCCAP